jgi:hypothetical protein
MLVQECFGVPAPLVEIDREDLDTARTVLAVQGVEGGKRGFAGCAPACPEVEQHDLPPEGREPHPTAFSIPHFDIRCRCLPCGRDLVRGTSKQRGGQDREPR